MSRFPVESELCDSVTGAGRPEHNCAEIVRRRVVEHGWSDRVALRTPAGEWTHGQVHDLAGRAATVLSGLGVRAGDRLLLALPDCAAWPVAFLAGARLGALVVCVNPGLSADEHRHVLDVVDPVVVIADEPIAGVHVLGGDDLCERARGAEVAPVAPVRPEDPLYAQFTSGTTGAPKGIVHTHADPGRYYELVGVPVVEPRPEDVTFSASKLYFAYGFGNAFVFPLWSGSSVVLMREKPTPRAVADLVATHGVTLLYAVPSLYAGLVAERPEAFVSVRAAVSAGEALPPAVAERTADLLGFLPLDQLGSTEAGHGICSNTIHDNRPGTIGRALPGYELRVVAENGEPVADGGEGRLWVRGPTLFQSFLDGASGAPGRNWWATGDLVVRRPDGALTHRGRIDDLEMVGGITVAPAEIERLLGGHRGVSAVVVTAVRDERGASKLWAFVVPAPEAGPLDQLSADLLALARRSLAPFKVPRGVRFVADLPRTATGKTRRFLVREGRW